jgi:hypothetical protein
MHCPDTNLGTSPIRCDQVSAVVFPENDSKDRCYMYDVTDFRRMTVRIGAMTSANSS